MLHLLKPRVGGTSLIGGLGLTLALLTSLACSSDPGTITIDVTTGYEADAFERDPAVQRLVLDAVAPDGAVLLSTETVPGGTFELGELSLEERLHLEVRGYDASGSQQIGGRTLSLVIGNLLSDTLPIFAQRLDRWSRPPGQLRHAHRGGVAGVLGERYLIHSGGDVLAGADTEPLPADVAWYDAFGLNAPVGGRLSFVPESLAISADGNAALLLGGEEASWIDFEIGDNVEPALPEGLASFAAVAGGRTVRGPDASYIVGATRVGEPSDDILVINADRSLINVKLASAREAAAAVWIDEVGLVVLGGSKDAPGIAVLPPGADQTTELAFPSDATRLAAAAPGLQSRQVVLVGGEQDGATANARIYDLSCAAACAAVALDVDLPIPLSRCQAFASSSGRLLVVGDDDDGWLRTFQLPLGGGAVLELPLREPRRGALALPSPTGTLALLGGSDGDDAAVLTIETLQPR